MKCDLPPSRTYGGLACGLRAAIVVASLVPVSGNVLANENPAPPPELTIAVGAGDVFDDSPETGYGVEYNHSPIWRDLRPAAGFSATTEGDWYIYAGVRYFFPLGDAWRFEPTIAVGYFEPGDGIDLGGSIEFRSGFVFSRRISARTRLALGFAHLSNASFYRSNPGTETLSLGVSILL